MDIATMSHEAHDPPADRRVRALDLPSSQEQAPKAPVAGLRARSPPAKVPQITADGISINIRPLTLAEYGRSESKLW